MDDYFYKHFWKEMIDKKGYQTKATKHRVLWQVGQNCNPCYPVTYEYTKQALIQYKPLTKDKPLTKILNSTREAIPNCRPCLEARRDYHVQNSLRKIDAILILYIFLRLRNRSGF